MTAELGPELGLVYCPTCRRDRFTEIPPCPDGHDERCPDRACVECGTALLFDALFRDSQRWDEAGFEPGLRARSAHQRRVA